MIVLIASGGSGGHIFPATALAKEFERDAANLIFVASRRHLDMEVLQNEKYKKIFLSANPMPHRFGFGIFVFLFKLMLDTFQAGYILVRYRPDVVVGFGGYTGGTILLLASLMKIKTVIHEQNLLPGRTNMILDGFADEIAVSFSETKDHFQTKNVTHTGNPLRKESLIDCREAAIKKFNLESGKFTILVMGGSQGARSLNTLVSTGLALLPREKKEKLQVIHIAGHKDYDKLQEVYLKNGIPARVFGFITNINEAYSVCDVVISRAGAAAISELAAFAKPMILIPYPSHKNNQRFNAMFFAENMAAIYKDEKSFTDSELKDLMIALLDNPSKLKILSENARKLSIVDGAERLKEVVLKCLATKYK